MAEAEASGLSALAEAVESFIEASAEAEALALSAVIGIGVGRGIHKESAEALTKASA